MKQPLAYKEYSIDGEMYIEEIDLIEGTLKIRIVMEGMFYDSAFAKIYGSKKTNQSGYFFYSNQRYELNEFEW